MYIEEMLETILAEQSEILHALRELIATNKPQLYDGDPGRRLIHNPHKEVKT